MASRTKMHYSPISSSFLRVPSPFSPCPPRRNSPLSTGNLRFQRTRGRAIKNLFFFFFLFDMFLFSLRFFLRIFLSINHFRFFEVDPCQTITGVNVCAFQNGDNTGFFSLRASFFFFPKSGKNKGGTVIPPLPIYQVVEEECTM